MAQYTRYQSTDSGAPVLDGTVGSLNNLLTKVLSNDGTGIGNAYGSTACAGWTREFTGGSAISISVLTRASNQATATTATNHGFLVGDLVTIAGANQSDYNGTFNVWTVSGPTTFQYVLATFTQVSPATGTITATLGGASVYRPAAGNRLRLRVMDGGVGTVGVPQITGGGKIAAIRGYEVMTDANTGTGPFPTSAQAVSPNFQDSLFVRKSNTADGLARNWKIFADGRTMNLFIRANDVSASLYWVTIFGEYFSFTDPDAYNTVLISRYRYDFADYQIETPGESCAISATLNGHFTARSYLQTGGSTALGKNGDGVRGTHFFGSVPFPNGPDGGILISPIYLTESTGDVRGRLRGLYQWLHPVGNAGDGNTFSGGGDYAGRNFEIVTEVTNTANAHGAVVMETSNTLETN